MVDAKLAKFYRGRWVAGLVTIPSKRGEIVMGIVRDEEADELRGVSRWMPGRDMIPDVGATVDRAIADPIEGRPHLPAVVRVADADLAEAVQQARPEVRVEIGPTPTLEAEAKRLAKELDDDEEWRWLQGDVDAAAVAALFEAAGQFIDSYAWLAIPPDGWVRVTLGKREVAVLMASDGSVTGGEVVSVAIAPTRAALDAWRDDQVPEDQLDVYFFDRDDLPGAAWDEVVAHGWKPTPDDQHPRVVAGGERERPPTAAEVKLATDALDALARFFRTGDADALAEFPDDRVVEKEVTLASGEVVRVTRDPADMLEPLEDDDEDEDDEEPDEKETAEDLEFLDLDGQNAWPAAPAPAPATVRVAAKPGRNDACWCGSGKKYKKCHLDEDEAKARA